MDYTILQDRILFFDGVSCFDPDNIIKLSKKYNVKYISRLTDDVKKYNSLVLPQDQLLVKTHADDLSICWNIPTEYQILNIIEHIFKKHVTLTKHITDIAETDARDCRLITEFNLFKKAGYEHVIRLMIYVVDCLERNDVVYGIGRGSCTSSYLLYVIGVHDIDSYEYNLEITDFIH